MDGRKKTIVFFFSKTKIIKQNANNNNKKNQYSSKKKKNERSILSTHCTTVSSIYKHTYPLNELLFVYNTASVCGRLHCAAATARCHSSP